MQQNEIIGHVAAIASAYLSNNQVDMSMLGAVLWSINGTLNEIVNGPPKIENVPLPEPAVPVKKSVFPDHLVCLDCGAKMKMLTRHVKQHGLTVDEYRSRWGLPASYPMVADGYSKLRSQMAKSFGLGHKRKGKK